MATIKAIEGRSVHQIQSGQVIVDLCSVVKELVENSLDAGASSIDIRFKNHGSDSIEVQDNGKGIASHDYETVALKHHTSKLSSYEDLNSLDTFGFRGEALSSLCALSKFHILTACTVDGAVGKRLDFEISGKLKTITVAAAQRGTTVFVDELFHNLPVRRRELEKNIKREYTKVLNFLHAYACISVGVRFSVSNQMVKGKKVIAFSTKSNTTTKENIVNVFGTKTLLALIKLDLHLEMQPGKGPGTQSARNWVTQPLDRSMEVRVEGHISKPVFGEGRQAPDRQMYFVNSRPCALPQVAKAVNEVYKSFNVMQSPFVFANLLMDTDAYDVNVSPDKRTIMLHEQTALLESLKAALTALFEQTDHTMPQSQLPGRKLPAYQPLTMSRWPSGESAMAASGDADADVDSDADQELTGENFETPKRAPIPDRHAVDRAANRTPASLIQNWMGRGTESRGNLSVSRKPSVPVVRDKVRLMNIEQKQDDNAEAKNGAIDPPIRSLSPSGSAESSVHDTGNMHDLANTRAGGIAWSPNRSEQVLPHGDGTTTEDPANPMSTAYDDLFSQRPAHLPRVSTQHVPPMASMVSSTYDHVSSSTDISPASPEPSIPAITTSSQKGTPGPVANAFDRMRPTRTPVQTAQITVGETTTTAVIGGSSTHKRRRIHAPQDSQAIAKFGGSPLLARGLRSFAAPGSQMLMQVDSCDIKSSKVGAAVAHESESDDSGEDAASEAETAGFGVGQPTNSQVQNAAGDDDNDQSSDPLDVLSAVPADDDEYDDDYIDEGEKRIREDEKVARLIQVAEDAAALPTKESLRRASQALKNGGNRKDSPVKLTQTLNASMADILGRATHLHASMQTYAKDREAHDQAIVGDELDAVQAESKLSLTVSKHDFARMRIVGQFNLGFVLAIRPGTGDDGDELFIVDQHAADEKYNYERLQRTVTLQSQRLVRPRVLELTAVEEEIILNNADALKANGFEIEITSPVNDDDYDDAPKGRQCHLLTLPISGQKTFALSDLEELLHLLSEAPAGSAEIPRPKKVQSMLAMRACRSSIMVGKTLTSGQMEKVVRHMGEMEKPWNCPHGRPTMRHLVGLGAREVWAEGDGIEDGAFEGADAFGIGRRTDWKGWLARKT